MHGIRELWQWWVRLPEGWRMALEYGDWALAVVWCVRTRTLLQRLPEVPDLSEPDWDLCPVGAPGLVVVVPAHNEAETLGPALETLLAQDYPWLQILVVNDRSTDATGALAEARAARIPDRLGVLHLTEVEEGWIAKTFAMEAAAHQSRSAWILFTEANVWFSPSLLRRALAYAEMSRADHLVVVPSPVIQSWGESVLLGFLQLFVLWRVRPWRVSDTSARGDAVGARAFNLVRREAWEELGGFVPQRLAVVDDVTLGRRFRAAGMQQRIAFAPGLVLVQWAADTRGFMLGITKNLFALNAFRLWVAGGFALFLVVVFLVPLPAMAWWRTVPPSVVILACIAVQYRTLGEITGIEARWGWLYPLGAMALLWAMIQSVAVTMWQGGVRWRGTFYGLRELRRANRPMMWEDEAAVRRAEERRVARGIRPTRFVRLASRLRKGAQQQRTRRRQP